MRDYFLCIRREVFPADGPSRLQRVSFGRAKSLDGSFATVLSARFILCNIARVISLLYREIGMFAGAPEIQEETN